MLLAGLGRQGGVQATGGWKRRTSIAPSDRSRWTGSGPLAEAVRSAVASTLPDAVEVSAGGLEAEPNLLLVQGTVNGARFSFGVRNSGTQAKTSLSARTDDPRLEDRMMALLQAVDDALRPALAPS